LGGIWQGAEYFGRHRHRPSHFVLRAAGAVVARMAKARNGAFGPIVGILH